MTWPAVLLVLLVSHAVGDVLLQTNDQAALKGGGIAHPRARDALLAHVAVYTLAYVPGLLWIGAHTSPGRAVLVGALIAVPHVVIDEGRLVRTWVHDVRRARDPPPALLIASTSACICCACSRPRSSWWPDLRPRSRYPDAELSRSPVSSYGELTAAILSSTHVALVSLKARKARRWLPRQRRPRALSGSPFRGISRRRRMCASSSADPWVRILGHRRRLGL